MTETFIHNTAIIANEQDIGAGTKIWVNVQIRENTSIGMNNIISKDVYIDEGVTIGNNCKIQNGVSIYKGVTVKDDVFIGPNAAFTNDKIPRAFNTDWTITPTILENGVSIGANATIICGVTIGEYAMVAAGSVVTKDVPPYTLVMGNPAQPYSAIDKAGNKVKS